MWVLFHKCGDVGFLITTYPQSSVFTFAQTHESGNVVPDQPMWSMSLIISFLNQKGGVGKSTLSINVAACFTLLKQKVLLIDADKQGTASTWASLPETDFQVVSMARENMARDALSLAADFDFTIIDGPPQAETISRSCIVASDLVVVPIEPGGASRWSSDLTVRQLKEAQELKPTLKCGFVVSRKIGSTVPRPRHAHHGRRCRHRHL